MCGGGRFKESSLNCKVRQPSRGEEESSIQGINWHRAKATSSLKVGELRKRLKARSPQSDQEKGEAMWPRSLAFILNCVFSLRQDHPQE